MQQTVWLLTVVVVAIIALIFLFVALNSTTRAEYPAVQARAYRFRSVVFWGLILAGIVIAAVTLRELPYTSAQAAPAAQVVNAKGYQWYWELDHDTVKAGQPVEFHVTSGDVNHGFGIYDADTRLVAQVQAMPGYVNRLRHTFDRPGTYRIMCLEYCGLVHHGMIFELQVVAPQNAEVEP